MSRKKRESLSLRVGLLAAGLLAMLAGCSRPSESPVAATPVESKVSTEQQELEALLTTCSRGRNETTPKDDPTKGRVFMEQALEACQEYLEKSRLGSSGKVTALSGEARTWLQRYTALEQASAQIKAQQFNEARGTLKTYAQVLTQGDVDELSARIDSQEAKAFEGWIPWALDMQGYDKGSCEITQLARSLEDVDRWVKESQGWIQVRSIRRDADKVAVELYDGLLKASGVRTFYKDMSTCKALRASP